MTGALYSSRIRAEQVIAVARAVLAACSLLAIWLDPTAPSKHANIAYSLLAVYLAYSLLLVFWVWRAMAPPERLGVFVHAFDLLAFTLFMYFTEGPTSPFFVYFVFAVIAAALRWQWRGALWTGSLVLTIFVGMGLYARYGLDEAQIDLNRFIMRGVYLGVVAALLAYATAYEQRLRQEMASLAAWPRGMPQSLEALAGRELRHVATIYGAPQLLMIWEETEEPWVYLARLSGDAFCWEREPPGSFEPWVTEPLADTHFLCADVQAATPTVVHTSGAGLQRWRGAPLHPDLRRRLDARSVLSVHLATDHLRGRIFVPVQQAITTDLLTLSALVSRLMQLDLNDFHGQQRQREAAVAEERVRLARDLHDGLLQSLAAMALQLEAARRSLDSDPITAREYLRNVQELLLMEQRDLRAFVQELKSVVPLPEAFDSELYARLEAFAARVSRQWQIRVDLDLERDSAALGDKLAHEVYRIVQAALINAARHAQASRVDVRLATGLDQVRITIADDGRGFPFRGHYNLAELLVMQEGPESITQRVSVLRGELRLESTTSGSRLEITLPLACEALPDTVDPADAHAQLPSGPF